MDLKSGSGIVPYAMRYLIAEGVACGRHCKEPVRFVTLFEDIDSLVGAYVCPEEYVSRAVYFASNPNPEWFFDFLVQQATAKRVRERDIRVATRHGWELGRDAEVEMQNVSPRGIKEYYWTFYAKNDSDKSSGTFLCPKEKGGCGRIFTQSLKAKSMLCPACSNP
ncbi:MAG TPA: hypothetical protein VJN71_09565 [Nitrososphaerales archaeon]|nr:hypothetical protein [Nitrososphaerales archaeon]